MNVKNVVKHINEESGEKLDTPTVVLEYLEKNYDLNPNDYEPKN